ncbi:hypothetical protein BRD17_02960 [Halobacteriales archaeon SW_7_68_16]|nr:MAG: hypothetical protein BRD17_02960 [Halobacteriales archaeon SW_7_68_16]
MGQGRERPPSDQEEYAPRKADAGPQAAVEEFVQDAADTVRDATESVVEGVSGGSGPVSDLGKAGGGDLFSSGTDPDPEFDPRRVDAVEAITDPDLGRHAEEGRMAVAHREDGSDLFVKEPGAKSRQDRELGLNAVLYETAAGEVGGSTCAVFYDREANVLVQEGVEGETLDDATDVDLDDAHREIAAAVLLGNWDCDVDNFMIDDEGRAHAIDLDEFGKPLDPERAGDMRVRGFSPRSRAFGAILEDVSETLARKGDGALAPDRRADIVERRLDDLGIEPGDADEPIAVDDQFRDRLREAAPGEVEQVVAGELERVAGVEMDSPFGTMVRYAHEELTGTLAAERARIVRERIRDEFQSLAEDADPDAIERALRDAAAERTGVDPDADGTLADHVDTRADIVRENVVVAADPDAETVVDWKLSSDR